MAKSVKERSRTVAEPAAISEIQVASFKSISDEQKIEIRPLTILAGANSSGKSSIMQPVLLLKQTLEAAYDPGPLLLNGPNVKFTSAEQLLSRTGKSQSSDIFLVGMRLNTGDGFVTTFRKEHKMGFRIERMEIPWERRDLTFTPEMTSAEIVKTGITKGLDISKVAPEGYKQGEWEIKRDRCFIGPVWVAKGSDGTSFSHGARPGAKWEEIIPHIIHLPGLRGNPERAYPVAAIGPTYPGTFEKYTASVISQWEEEKSSNLDDLNTDLRSLKLTGGVRAKPLYAVQLELYVGRLPDVSPEMPENQVNIADVGVGVSQTLPVLVALHAAKPGQLVYVEQPETHLHPRAQFDLAQILASAAKRGVRVVVETHSSILLLGVQTLVAEGSLEPDKVKLHWFQRGEDGRTIVNSADLDEAGAFGDWPEDFDDVDLQTQARYLDAASARRLHKQGRP
jgi:hypothetical protein